MKTFCVLAVVVVAVAATPDCPSYCDKLYSGWKVDRRSDCNCDAPKKELQDIPKYEHDLKSILLPGFLPSEIKLNKIKRSLPDGYIPLERAHNSTITSKSSDDVLNNSQIIAMNLSDCIDLHISISIRKNKNKSIDISPEKNNSLEINTEIKNKCEQAPAITQKSVDEIKEHEKNISNKNQNVDVIPKLDIRSAFDLTDEKTPTTSTNDDKGINSTVKSTPPYEKPYTNNTTTILDSAVNYFNLSKTLKDNIQEETKKKYKKDDDNTTNLNVNTTSTKLKNLPTSKFNKSILSYKLRNLKNNKLNYEFSSQNPLTFEKIQNESKLMADYSDNVNESTSISNQNIKSNNKTVVLETVNQNENNISLRDRYEENVPIVNIITREYPNNTISSFLNGTETLTYSKFEDDGIINNNNTENTNDSRLFEKLSKSLESELEIRSQSDETTPPTSEEQSSVIMSPAINGRLFFEYEQEHIPGQFVQTSDGRLHLSLDINTICNELIQKGKQTSLLIPILCQYLNKKYQSIEYGI